MVDFAFALFSSVPVEGSRPTGNRAGAYGAGAHIAQVQRVEGGQRNLGAGDLRETEPTGGAAGHESCGISQCCSSGGDQFIETPHFYCIQTYRAQTHAHTRLYTGAQGIK